MVADSLAPGRPSATTLTRSWLWSHIPHVMLHSCTAVVINLVFLREVGRLANLSGFVLYQLRGLGINIVSILTHFQHDFTGVSSPQRVISKLVRRHLSTRPPAVIFAGTHQSWPHQPSLDPVLVWSGWTSYAAPHQTGALPAVRTGDGVSRTALTARIWGSDVCPVRSIGGESFCRCIHFLSLRIVIQWAPLQ